MLYGSGNYEYRGWELVCAIAFIVGLAAGAAMLCVSMIMDNLR
jgi:hypothetical protein